MPRAPIFTVESKQLTEPWRSLWSGLGQGEAIDHARRLSRLTRGNGAAQIFLHPFIRVRQGREVLLSITPLDREG